ncbi:MAG: Putative 3-oxopropanoate dehydrogenase [Candidatus Celerinatantimonas neptuna]|nr:MAG: Putative 3-oxopropanoate dehydrogenase [Candidatus Celerinatantimonas neptuna]
MTRQVPNFVNGEHHFSQSSRIADIHNPATGDIIAQVALSSASEINHIVSHSLKAQLSWREQSPLKRARVMFKFKELLEHNTKELATLISQEHGKTHSDAKGELTRGIEVVEFACGIPHLLKGEFSSHVGTGVDSFSMMQPLGVCVGITPFNFPAMVPLWMYPIALCCGNSFILKPSEKAPSASIKMAELLQQAGLPDGVFQVVHGDKEIVDALLSHPDIAAVSFVGSTPVAKTIYQKGCAEGKRVQALGGAKNHLLVMPDADLQRVGNALMAAAYGATGERCMAISVAVVVGDKTADALIEHLAPRVESLKVGPGLAQPENDMGPLISEAHLLKVRGYIEQGAKEGAELVVDGRELESETGYFLGGTLFDHVTPNMRIYREEIFGPVLAVVRVESYEQGLALINGHEFANGTAIFTQNGHWAHHFYQHVEVGMVGINVPIPVPMAFHSFGGWKRSIFGPLNMHGPDGVRFYTRMKTVTSSWPQDLNLDTQYSMPTME